LEGSTYFRDYQASYIESALYYTLHELQHEIEEESFELVFTQGQKLTDELMRSVFNIRLQTRINYLKSKERLFDEEIDAEFIRTQTPFLAKIIELVFPQLSRHEDFEKLLLFTFLFFLSKDFSYSNLTTGLVFCGFGTEDIFPSLIEYQINGMIVGKIRSYIDKERKIDNETTAQGTAEIN
jgi:hypothetical protein